MVTHPWELMLGYSQSYNEEECATSGVCILGRMESMCLNEAIGDKLPTARVCVHDQLAISTHDYS